MANRNGTPLVTVGGKGLGDLAVDLGGLLGLGEIPPGGLLALVVGRALGLSTLLESIVTSANMVHFLVSEIPGFALGIPRASRDTRHLKGTVPLNNTLVFPADFVAQTTNDAVLAARL